MRTSLDDEEAMAKIRSAIDKACAELAEMAAQKMYDVNGVR